MSKYNKSIATAIRKVSKPVPVKIAVMEYPEFLQINVFENEIMAMNEGQRMQVMEYLLQCRDVVESFGVRCELGGLTGDPR